MAAPAGNFAATRRTPLDWLQRYADAPWHRVVGLMSGTSFDGIDAVVAQIAGSGRQATVQSEAFVTVAFPADPRERGLALNRGEGDAEEVSRLHFALGTLLADAAQAVLDSAGLTKKDIDLVASHGQTVSHTGGVATLQIGAPAILAHRMGVPVVADFRAADIAAGGQGAPLVPYADWCLLTDPHRSRVLQNIGGIGNLTYLPAEAALSDVVGFDTGPGVMLIDRAATWLTNGALHCDLDGHLADQGTVDAALLGELLAHPFLATPPPRSAGREEFGAPFFDAIVAAWGDRPGFRAALIPTLTAFTARTIGDACRRFLPRLPDEFFVGGGGARNPALMRFLQRELEMVPVRPIDALGINVDSKEALAFALLAHETMLGRSANVPRVTGAHGPVLLGSITFPSIDTDF